MSIGIYKIENLINGKIYIGQSIHIEKRWSEHCKASSCSLISKAIKKYGKDNFSFQILEECSVDSLTKKESEYIAKYNSLAPNGYNITLEDAEHGRAVFKNYPYEVFLSLVHDIKNTDLSFQTLAEKYDLDVSMIYYINRGDYHTIPNELYPLRKVKDFSKKIYKCIDCGKVIYKGSTRCEECGHKAQRKCERPSREELKDLIRNCPFTKIGEVYGVTDNAIRKWCKAENLPSKTKDIKSYSDEEWQKL